MQCEKHNLCLKIISILTKIFLSGILSLIILSLIFTLYINTANTIIDYTGATDFKHEPFAFYSQYEEGGSTGRFNNDGYNNLYDYEPGMNIDVLFMGSSHMEALHVKQNENAAAVLEKISGLKVYNIGTVSHYFLNCISNLEAAVKKYSPSKYIIIETAEITLTDDELKQILSESVPKQGNREAKSFLRLFLRRSPYLRYLVRKSKIIFQRKNVDEGKINTVHKNNPALLSRVLEKMKRSSPAKIIIASRPPIILNDDGTMKIDSDDEEKDIKIFSELCKENGIYVIDMSKRFLDEYAKNFAIPYGFFNTSQLDRGHLNKQGHKFFAEEIYKKIREIEAQS